MTRSHFFKRLFLFGLLLIISDAIAGTILSRLYFRQRTGENYHTTVAAERQTAEVVVLGSSRARNHYDPALLGDSLGRSCYNAGRHGMFLFYHAAVLEMMLERYKPQMVILDLAPYEFEPGEEGYDRLSILLPYHRHPSMKRTLQLKSSAEPVKLLSQTYPYNSMLLRILSGNVYSSENIRADGFEPVEGTLPDSEPAPHICPTTELDSVKLGTLETVIGLCKENHIELFVVVSPFFESFDTETPTLQAARHICHASGTPFLSFLNRKDFARSDLYFTTDHLNDRGARYFSEQLAGSLNALRTTE